MGNVKRGVLISYKGMEILGMPVLLSTGICPYLPNAAASGEGGTIFGVAISAIDCANAAETTN